MILLILTLAAILVFSFQTHEWELRCRFLAEELDDYKQQVIRLESELQKLKDEQSDIA